MSQVKNILKLLTNSLLTICLGKVYPNWMFCKDNQEALVRKRDDWDVAYMSLNCQRGIFELGFSDVHALYTSLW